MYAEPRSPSETPAEASAWLDESACRRALSYLNYGLVQAEGFIVLTGPRGTGTTALLDRLLAASEQGRLTVMRVSAEQVMAEMATLALSRALGLSARIDDASLLDTLEERLESDLRAGRRNLLIVEDAQELSNAAFEELIGLSDLRAGGRALIQILLLGSPELRQRLDASSMEPLRKRIIASHDLGGIASSEGFGEPNLGEARVLPLRSGRGAAISEAPSLEAKLGDRMATLEARVEEQEAMLRRMLTLLVDWTERRGPAL